MGFLFREFGKTRSTMMSQDELAEKSGVKASRIKNYECGRRKAHIEDVEAMCKALGVKFTDYYKKECVVLSFISNKGGSSKSTSSVNTAFTLANNYNCKVLLIDSDMQQNASQHLNISIDDDKNFYRALTLKQSLLEHIKPTRHKNLDIVTSHDGMSMIETEMAVSMELKELRVKKILKPVKDQGAYDFIIIDTNPSLGQLNRAILYATDAVIIPLEPSAFGMRGLEFLTRFINGIDDENTIKILGILVNKFDMRKRVPKDVISIVEKQFGDKSLLFKTKISVDTSVEQAQMLNEPLGVNFSKSKANLSFIELCDEIINRSEKVVNNG